MSPLEFYTDQAAKQSAAGDQADLQNVRERCRRAASAWAVLAARERRSDAARALKRKALEGADGGSLPIEPAIGST